MKRLLTTVAALVVLTGAAFAKDESPAALRATLAAMVGIHALKCSTKPTDNAITLAQRYEATKAYTDKQFNLAVAEQNALIKAVGRDAWCLVSEGAMSKMDKDIATARGQ